jgi:protein-S-isoprenylcysteine O-methyltransferase Ste14
MAYMLYFGMTRGIAPLHYGGRILNILLLIQLPVMHSFFLSRKGSRLLISLFPKRVGSAFAITIYSTIASLQVLVLFVLWNPDSNVWFVPTGWLLTLWNLTYVISWILLARSIFEAGAAVQTGYLGWSSVFLGRPLRFPPLPTSGLHSVIRHPIYLSFALITLTGPFWGFDHLILAGIIVPYCVFGPLLKERRIRGRIEDQYNEYAKRTPYMAPKIIKRRKKNYR